LKEVTVYRVQYHSEPGHAGDRGTLDYVVKVQSLHNIGWKLKVNMTRGKYWYEILLSVK